jgi:hypothetical protein
VRDEGADAVDDVDAGLVAPFGVDLAGKDHLSEPLNVALEVLFWGG